MSASKLRGFLLTQPKPASLRVTIDGSDPVDVKMGRSFAKTAETLIAMDADRVEALDATGAVLRAVKLSSSEFRRSDTPALPESLKDNPEAAMFVIYAQGLSRAYEHATEIAFTKVVELADRLGNHIEGIEARLHRTELALQRANTELIDDAWERAQEAAEKAGEPGVGDQMMQAFLSGQLQQRAPTVHAAARASNGKSNGHSNGKRAKA